MKLKKLIEKLYHKDIFLPNEVSDYVGFFYRLLWTPHAKKAAMSDRYGVIDISKIDKMLKVDLKDVIEAEKDDTTGQVVKIVVRKPYDKDKDIVLALIPHVYSREATVKTCWLNKKSDKHSTLRKDLYADK
jgi:hypothetical protein